MANGKGSAAHAEAGETPVTMESLRAKLNEVAELLNGAVESLDAQARQLATMTQEQTVQALRIKQLSEAPLPVNVEGGTVTDLLERIALLEARVTGVPMNPQQQKEADKRAMEREAKQHAGDRMMYHPDPKHPQVAKVVHSDAEEKAAVLEGYHPTLAQAAAAGLGAASGDGKAVVARIEELKRAMMKVA